MEGARGLVRRAGLGLAGDGIGLPVGDGADDVADDAAVAVVETARAVRRGDRDRDAVVAAHEDFDRALEDVRVRRGHGALDLDGGHLLVELLLSVVLC